MVGLLHFQAIRKGVSIGTPLSLFIHLSWKEMIYTTELSRYKTSTDFVFPWSPSPHYSGTTGNCGNFSALKEKAIKTESCPR